MFIFWRKVPGARSTFQFEISRIRRKILTPLRTRFSPKKNDQTLLDSWYCARSARVIRKRSERRAIPHVGRARAVSSCYFEFESDDKALRSKDDSERSSFSVWRVACLAKKRVHLIFMKFWFDGLFFRVRTVIKKSRQSRFHKNFKNACKKLCMISECNKNLSMI